MEALTTTALERAFRSGLKLGHLRMLTLLAQVGRVSRVAELFNVTQPAISKQLAELEILLGTPVVARSGRRVVLTAAGEILVKHGRQVLYTLDAARREIEDLQEGLAGSLRVGAVATAMPPLVAAGIVRLRQRAPAITITLFEATTSNLFPMVREGHLDVVVSRTRIDRIKAEPLPLEERLIGVDPLVIVCAGQNPLAGRKSLRWAELAEQSWILPPEGSAIHDGLVQLFEKHGLRLGPGSIMANSIAALPRLLRDGQFIALMPRAYAQEYVDRGVLAMLPLAFSHTAQQVRAVWRREQETPALRLFLQSLASPADF